MKAIIYAGIGLFSVATVYGIADYYTTQKKGTLDKLYKEQEEVTEAPVVKTVATNVEPASVNEAGATNNIAVVKTNKKSKNVKRTIRLDDFSRGRIEERITVVEPIKELPEKPVPPVVEVKVETPEPVVVEKKEERKFSFDQFSRAPLRNPSKKLVAKKS